MRLNPATLTEIRRSKGLSIADVARRTEDGDRSLDRSTISNFEHGYRNAPPWAIVALAAALDVAPYALCGPEDPAKVMRELVQRLGLTADDLFGDPVMA